MILVNGDRVKAIRGDAGVGANQGVVIDADACPPLIRFDDGTEQEVGTAWLRLIARAPVACAVCGQAECECTDARYLRLKQKLEERTEALDKMTMRCRALSIDYKAASTERDALKAKLSASPQAELAALRDDVHEAKSRARGYVVSALDMTMTQIVDGLCILVARYMDAPTRVVLEKRLDEAQDDTNAIAEALGAPLENGLDVVEYAKGVKAQLDNCLDELMEVYTREGEYAGRVAGLLRRAGRLPEKDGG